MQPSTRYGKAFQLQRTACEPRRSIQARVNGGRTNRENKSSVICVHNSARSQMAAELLNKTVANL